MCGSTQEVCPFQCMECGMVWQLFWQRMRGRSGIIQMPRLLSDGSYQAIKRVWHSLYFIKIKFHKQSVLLKHNKIQQKLCLSQFRQASDRFGILTQEKNTHVFLKDRRSGRLLLDKIALIWEFLYFSSFTLKLLRNIFTLELSFAFISYNRFTYIKKIQVIKITYWK